MADHNIVTSIGSVAKTPESVRKVLDFSGSPKISQESQIDGFGAEQSTSGSFTITKSPQKKAKKSAFPDFPLEDKGIIF
jgi:hypothetical protein